MPSRLRFLLACTFLFIVPVLSAQTGDWTSTQNTGPRLTGPNAQPAQDRNGNVIDGPLTTLFAYGSTYATDSFLPTGDDSSLNLAPSWLGAGPEGSSLTLNFYGKSWNGLWVNNNGNLSFGTYFSSYVPASLQTLTTPVVAPFWADVDTQSLNSNQPGGKVWYRTTQDATELAAIGTRVENSYSGTQNFHPTFATVVTWDKVGKYPEDASNVSTWQAVIASDGITTYTLFLYPTRAIWWDYGSYSGNTFAAIGVTAGDGVNFTEIAGSRTSSVRDVWFLSNTTPAKPGTFAFDVSGTQAPLVVAGNLTLPATAGTAAAVLRLGANAGGHTITSTAAAGSLLFNQLVFDNPADSVRFTDRVVVLANAAGAITQGNLTFTDNTVLVARATGALNGGTLTLANNARLALYAANAVTTATTLNFSRAGGPGGTLDLRAFDATVSGLHSLDSGAGVVTNSGATTATLTLAGAGTSTFSGVLTNGTSPLAVRKIDTGTQILAGANTYTGGTTISGGTLVLGASERLADTGAVTLNGGTLDLGGFSETVGAFSLTSGALTGAGALTASSFAFDHIGNITVSARLGGGALTKSGAGTLTLVATNTYAGGTLVNGGTLSISADAQLGDTSGPLTLNGGTLRTTAGIASTRAIALAASGGTVDVSAGQTTTFDGLVSGTGGLVKTGAGSLTLSAANTFSGGTVINAGTLIAAHNGEFSTFAAGSTVTVNSGGTLQVNGSDALGWGNGNAKLAVNGGTVTTDGSAGQHTSLQTVTLTAGRLTDTGGNGQYFLNGPLVTNASATTATIDSARFELGNGWVPGTTSLTVADGAAAIDLDIASNVIGSGPLVKNGAGLLRLTGNNSYAGGTTLNAGTLLLGHGAALGTSGTITFGGGTLRYSAAATTDYSGRFSSAAGQQYRIDTNGQNVTFASPLASAGGTLVKTGTGTLTLSGANTYTGATAVNAGTLVVNGSARASAFTVNSGATLAGTGTVGALTIASGATLAPGHSPGTLNAGSTTLAGGGNYTWEIDDAIASATPGTNWDLLNVTGTLTFTATAGNPFTISLRTLTAADISGPLANFNVTAPNYHTYTIATASDGVFGFDAHAIRLDLSGFANDLAGGTWSITQAGNNVNLVFASAIPEPGTSAAALAVAALVATLYRRRRRTLASGN